MAWHQSYDDVHGQGFVRNMWRSNPKELHQSVCILLHFAHFCIRRQVHHPNEQWGHVPCQVSNNAR